jgi:23S rRNA (pseudouridine1915-N3)-methyltransferase
MRILIAAVGKLRRGPEREIIDTYLARMRWDITIREVDAPGRFDTATRKQRESAMLLDTVSEGAALVALDRQGRNIGSEAFAQRVGRWRDGGRPAAFLIGGAAGLDGAVLDRADLTLAFGAMTWPHLLARCMLVEQLYRAHQILAGHPYHRA